MATAFYPPLGGPLCSRNWRMKKLAYQSLKSFNMSIGADWAICHSHNSSQNTPHMHTLSHTHTHTQGSVPIAGALMHSSRANTRKVTHTHTHTQRHTHTSTSAR